MGTPSRPKGHWTNRIVDAWKGGATSTTNELRLLWNSLTIDEREIVIEGGLAEDWPREAWDRIVHLGLRDGTGALTPLGDRVRKEWQEVWHPQALEKFSSKRRERVVVVALARLVVESKGDAS